MNNDLSTDDVLLVFRMYIGLKLHFNSDSYIYNDGFGHDKINAKSMDKRKDMDVFIKVTDNFYNKNDELKEIMISLLKNDKSMWIGDVLQKTKQKIHKNRMNNIMNLSEKLKNDIDDVSYFLKVNNISLRDSLMFTDDRPLLVKKVKVSDEFLSLLDNYIPYLNQVTENPLWKKRSYSLYKYKHLIKIYNKSCLDLLDDFVK